MRARELTRVEVLARVKAGALRVRSAAVLLQVGTVRRSGWCAAIEHGARRGAAWQCRASVQSRTADGGARSNAITAPIRIVS